MNYLYDSLLQSATGLFLLSAVLMVWRKELRSLVSIAVLQGISLGVVPLILGIKEKNLELIFVAFIVFSLRAIVVPRVILKLVKTGTAIRETAPYLNTAGSLLVCVLIIGFAYYISKPIVNITNGNMSSAVPIALAVVFIGMFNLINRRRTVSQVVAFLVIDNGISALAFFAVLGVPLIVELAMSLDVLLLMVVMQLVASRLDVQLGINDLDDLRELHE